MIMADTKTNLRLPDELYDEIRRFAEKEHRSINGQMVAMLQEATDRRLKDEKDEPKRS